LRLAAGPVLFWFASVLQLIFDLLVLLLFPALLVSFAPLLLVYFGGRKRATWNRMKGFVGNLKQELSIFNTLCV
jgi:hypothetical protein